jgi:FkbM family methyltransferase
MSAATLDLDTLLAERPEDAAARAAGAFAAAVGDRPLVLHGAGGVGRRVLEVLRARGVEPLCFSDANAQPGAPDVDGVAVLPLAEATARHGAEAAFVVTVLNPHATFNEIEASLRAAGAETVLSWALLAWAEPDALLPHYPLDLPQNVLSADHDAIRAAYALLDDDASRAEYLAQLAWRLTADFALLGPHAPSEDQYFSPDVLRIRSDEVFVDCGAFDGDSLVHLLQHIPDGIGRVIALEPDPANIDALNARIATFPADFAQRVELLPWAAGAERGTARWGGEGTAAAGIADEGEIEVEVVPLDELLDRDIVPTYVKMDIEGAEPDALRGLTRTLEHRPALAVCVYHEQAHLWELPLQVAGMVDDYRFVLRRYEGDCFDVVLYALPRER